MLESTLRKRLAEKEILLMTHIVLGYPSFASSLQLVEVMVEAGVDLMELQVPFSEPIADGPVILKANQESLAAGATVARCFELAREVAARFPIPFLFMSYYNILYKYGVARFASAMAAAGLQGAIVPDLPPEEGQEYLDAMAQHGLAPIFIFSPTTPSRRMETIASLAGGFVYCVARKGVTGVDTHFSRQLEEYLTRCRQATHLPLALGFGVQERTDVEFLKNKVDIAVIGTQTIRVMERDGIAGVGDFIRSLR